MEKPQELSGKSSPGGESDAGGFSEGKPEEEAQGFAFGKSQVIQIFRYSDFPDITQGLSTICETLVSYRCMTFIHRDGLEGLEKSWKIRSEICTL